MNYRTYPQELARRFNEDEAVWQRYEYKRRLRQYLGTEEVAEDILDELAWIEAEHECRHVTCVGNRL